MRSAAVGEGAITTSDQVREWLVERAASTGLSVARIPFHSMSGWRFEPASGNMVHTTGRFFSIEGLRVRLPGSSTSGWDQPIILQPEIGILGILAREYQGVLHFLMQLKIEPGYAGYQLAPTVQATNSNFTGVHKGRLVRYLNYFRSPSQNRVLVDTLQSEQGSWFLHKRNRNVVVEALGEVPPDPAFRWLTLGQIRKLLQRPNTVNMDARTVLSCIPFGLAGAGVESWRDDGPDGEFGRSVLESLTTQADPLHRIGDVLRWITEARAERDYGRRCVPLNEVLDGRWYRDPTEIGHESGNYFKIIGVSVTAQDREVKDWCQPLLAPTEAGVIALLTKRISGLLDVLVHARPAAGLLNGPELAPTVQCQPGNYRSLPEPSRPRYLGYVLGVDPGQIRYDKLQSEEGGRFYNAQNRYMIIEAEDFPFECPDDYRWMTLGQLSCLVIHSHYLNVELRSLLACTYSLW